MVHYHYVVIRKNVEASEPKENHTYGIGVYRLCAGFLEIISCVYDISDDVAWLKALVDKLNLYDVDPIHLHDIIEDELYNVEHSTAKCVRKGIWFLHAYSHLR